MSELEFDEGLIPTKDLLRKKRQEAYAKAKAEAKKLKKEAKAKLQAERERAREERDLELWQMLRPGNEIIREEKLPNQKIVVEEP